MSADDPLERAEDLLAAPGGRAREARGDHDPDQAIEVLQELSDLARQIEVELQAARRAAEADAADS